MSLAWATVLLFLVGVLVAVSRMELSWIFDGLSVAWATVLLLMAMFQSNTGRKVVYGLSGLRRLMDGMV